MRASKQPIDIPNVMEKPPMKLIRSIIFGSYVFFAPIFINAVVAKPLVIAKMSILIIPKMSPLKIDLSLLLAVIKKNPIITNLEKITP